MGSWQGWRQSIQRLLDCHSRYANCPVWLQDWLSTTQKLWDTLHVSVNEKMTFFVRLTLFVSIRRCFPFGLEIYSRYRECKSSLRNQKCRPYHETIMPGQRFSRATPFWWRWLVLLTLSEKLCWRQWWSDAVGRLGYDKSLTRLECFYSFIVLYWSHRYR